jgi:hypothetical protein
MPTDLLSAPDIHPDLYSILDYWTTGLLDYYCTYDGVMEYDDGVWDCVSTLADLPLHVTRRNFEPLQHHH